MVRVNNDAVAIGSQERRQGGECNSRGGRRRIVAVAQIPVHQDVAVVDVGVVRLRRSVIASPSHARSGCVALIVGENDRCSLDGEGVADAGVVPIGLRHDADGRGRGQNHTGSPLNAHANRARRSRGGRRAPRPVPRPSKPPPAMKNAVPRLREFVAKIT